MSASPRKFRAPRKSRGYRQPENLVVCAATISDGVLARSWRPSNAPEYNSERHLFLIGTLVPIISPREPYALPITRFALPVPGDRRDYPALMPWSKAKVERIVPEPAIDGPRTRCWRKRNGTAGSAKEGVAFALGADGREVAVPRINDHTVGEHEQFVVD